MLTETPASNYSSNTFRPVKVMMMVEVMMMVMVMMMPMIMVVVVMINGDDLWWLLQLFLLFMRRVILIK